MYVCVCVGVPACKASVLKMSSLELQMAFYVRGAGATGLSWIPVPTQPVLNRSRVVRSSTLCPAHSSHLDVCVCKIGERGTERDG